MRLSLLYEADATGKADILDVAKRLETDIFPDITRLGKHIHGFKFHWPSPVSAAIQDGVINIDIIASAANRIVAKETFRIGVGEGQAGKQQSKKEKWDDIMQKVEQATQSIPLFLAKTIFGVLNKERRTPRQRGPVITVVNQDKKVHNFPITPSGLRDLKLYFWHWAEDAAVKVIPGVKKVR